jgi:phosphonate transport system substrate-binding protein
MGRLSLALCLILLTVCAATACAAQTDAAVISLSTLEPLPAPHETAVVPLRVAVASIVSPSGTVNSYDPLLAYLSERLDRPVELIQRRTYAETNDLIARGEIDLAFVCTSAYVAGVRDFGLKLLAAPQVDGEIVYHSLLLVPAGSEAQSMADLRGGVFAFTDPMSTTGRNYPIVLVQELGEGPETFFARTFYTYSHDDAIRAVAAGVADGAAVDSLVYEHAVQREPELAEQVRIIHQSPPYGIPPVVIGHFVRPQHRAELLDILLSMAEDPAGRLALDAAGIDRFVITEDAAYDTVRELEARVAPVTAP